MPSAEIIAIGTELLLGEISDTNTKFLARQLRDCGIDLFRSTTVGDNIERITSAICESLNRADVVITTGGLGPTIDDPTRDAAARAFNIPNEFHPELWAEIQLRFHKRGLPASENNKRQAFIPSGALVIKNPVGTAPAFIIERAEKCLICLPGVPSEMETLTNIAVMPFLRNKFLHSGIILARVLHTSGLGESVVDDLIGDLEKLSNPTVGLLAHPGIVDIRITAKADTIKSAEQMISGIESKIRERIPEDIFGVDGETLPSSILKLIEEKDIRLSVLWSGFLQNAPFSALKHPNVNIESLASRSPGPVSTPNKDAQNGHRASQRNVSAVFTLNLSKETTHLEVSYFSTKTHATLHREFAGSPAIAEEWAENFCLGFIRKQLLKFSTK
jgi:nicotinamide-nucleotide amidase